MKDDEVQPKGKLHIIAKVHEWGKQSRLSIDPDIIEEYDWQKMKHRVSNTDVKDEMDLEIGNIDEEAKGF